MIVKILGAIDFLAVIVLLFAGILPPKLLMIFALLLVAKGAFFAFSGNLVSILDIAIGLYMFFVAYGHPTQVLTVISLIYLAQKAFLSFV